MKIFRLLLLINCFLIAFSCGGHEQLWDYEDDDLINNDIYSGSQNDSINNTVKSDSSKTLPLNRAIEDAMTRAYQLRETKWTAINYIPNVNSTKGYSPDKEYSGLPYSSTKEIDKYIGFDVSLYSFLTAVNNPYSLLYTEDISTRNMSAYNYTYHGEECGPYMGIHCSSYVAYALGFPLPWITAQYEYLSDINFLEKIPEPSVLNIKKMDIIWQKGHVRLITDIIFNKDSSIQKLVITESVKNLPRTVNYSPQSFNELISNNKIVYRYNDLKEIRYPQIDNIHYNNDICTFRGDSVTFREGETIIINYNLRETNVWKDLELYKDNYLFSVIPINNMSHECNLSYLNLKCGNYKARLVGEKKSDFTYFEILDTQVSYIGGKNNQTIQFSSKIGKPIYFLYCYENGWNMGTHIFTDEEVSQGYVTLNSVSMLKEQHKNEDRKFAKKTFLKVFFQGKYGRITNEPIITDLF